MAVISRERIQIVHEEKLAVGEDIQLSDIVPPGEVWQVKRITFGDVSITNNNAGLFKVDYGVDGDRDILAVAYLTGNTIVIPINRGFAGDGIKQFRFIREVQSNPAKKMLIFMEGFKRTGDL